jgi:hypothetical protein
MSQNYKHTEEDMLVLNEIFYYHLKQRYNKTHKSSSKKIQNMEEELETLKLNINEGRKKTVVQSNLRK